jgi:hypothetical protein
MTVTDGMARLRGGTDTGAAKAAERVAAENVPRIARPKIG